MQRAEEVSDMIVDAIRKKGWAFSHVVAGNLDGAPVWAIVLHNDDLILLCLNDTEMAEALAGDSAPVLAALDEMQEAFARSGQSLRAN